MKDQYRAIGSWGTVGLEIVVSIILGFLAGRWADGRLGTEPWLQIVGFLLGCGAGGRAIHRVWKEMMVVAEREEREQGNPRQMYEKAEPRKSDDEGDPRTR